MAENYNTYKQDCYGGSIEPFRTYRNTSALHTQISDKTYFQLAIFLSFWHRNPASGVLQPFEDPWLCGPSLRRANYYN